MQYNPREGEDPAFKFCVTKQEVYSHSEVPINAVKLFSLRNRVGYMTPMIHLRHSQ